MICTGRALVAVVAVSAALGAPGCPTPCTVDADCPLQTGCVDGACRQQCADSRDCPVGTDCNARGQCLESATGTVRWADPAPDTDVAARFDGAVNVRFRAREALLRVMRASGDPGSSCAPMPPIELRVPGDPAKTFEQRVQLPGLFAAGVRFSLVVTMEAAGGFTSDTLALRGPDFGSSPLTITLPLEGDIEGDPVLVDVSAAVTALPQAVQLRVQPVQGAPGAGVALEPTAERLSVVRVPVARGAQSILLEGSGPDGEPFTCGRGVRVAETGTGLELALWFEASADDALVGMRVRLDGADGSEICAARAPAAGCTVVRAAAGAGATGDEVLSIDLTNGVVSVAVVPAAISAPVRAGVRVSWEGRHVAFLGPFSLDPSQGEVWIAGDIALAGGVPTVTPRFERTIGSPF